MPTNSISKEERKKHIKRKTNKELADYLSFITPSREEIYQAIAEFLGEEKEIK
jgi:ribosomal protein S24E